MSGARSVPGPPVRPLGLPPLLEVALYGLVLDGLVALYLGGFVGPIGLGSGAVLVVATRWAPALGRALPGGSALGRLVVPAAAVASVLDAVFLADAVVDALVRLLGFVLVYRLSTLRGVRESRTVTFLAFFMLVAASTSAFGIGYLFVLLAFVALVTLVLMLQHALEEVTPTPRRQAVEGSLVEQAPRHVLALAGAAALGIVVVAAGFFAALPRIGLAALPLRVAEGQRVSGFSDRVELGAFGPILLDDSVVMRVHLPDDLDPGVLAGLRWRGVALDRFDGRSWSVSAWRRVRVLRVAGGRVRLGFPRGEGRIVRQEVFLEPVASDILFAAPRVLTLGIRTDLVGLDDAGTIMVARPQARLAYAVESELEPAPGSGLGEWMRSPAFRERYLQLPPLSPRVGALARRVAGGTADPRQAALQLSAYLAREYRYTLSTAPPTLADPIEEFLFVRREGHCEYFAAALAVMLRGLDIPARVVNGFQRGEWNPYGRYFLVRLRDAHSWVEAYVDGPGWITLDPSPRGGALVPSPASRLALVVDALRLRWHRYVIQWSLRDQARVATELQRLAARGGEAVRGARAIWAGRRAGDLAQAGLAVALTAALLVAVFRWWRPGRSDPRRAPTGRPPEFYRRALRRLARLRLAPRPAETAGEFAERAGVALGKSGRGAGGGTPGQTGAPLAVLTRFYERDRFGGRPPDGRERAEIEAALRGLDAMIRLVRSAPGRGR